MRRYIDDEVKERVKANIGEVQAHFTTQTGLAIKHTLGLSVEKYNDLNRLIACEFHAPEDGYAADIGGNQLTLIAPHSRPL